MTITSVCHVGVFMAGGLHFRMVAQKKKGDYLLIFGILLKGPNGCQKRLFNLI
jgi:hypothetical protein